MFRDLPEGTCQLTASADGHAPFTAQCQVIPGEPRKEPIEIVLKRNGVAR